MSDQEPMPPALSFGSVAAAYDRGRPGYPAPAVTWLVGGETRIVLELGAGTGKLTSALVGQGHAVHATDPDAITTNNSAVPAATITAPARTDRRATSGPPPDTSNASPVHASASTATT